MVQACKQSKVTTNIILDKTLWKLDTMRSKDWQKYVCYNNVFFFHLSQLWPNMKNLMTDLNFIQKQLKMMAVMEIPLAKN